MNAVDVSSLPPVGGCKVVLLTVRSEEITWVPEERENPFQQELLAQTGNNLYVLDLTGVRLMDSSGIGVVVGFNIRVHKQGGRLKVVVAEGSTVDETLMETKLNQLFPVFWSLEAAQESSWE